VTVSFEVKLEKAVVAQCFKETHAVTTLCRFRCGVSEVRAVPSAVCSIWLFVEFFVQKWSVRPRVTAFKFLKSSMPTTLSEFADRKSQLDNGLRPTHPTEIYTP